MISKEGETFQRVYKVNRKISILDLVYELL